MRRGPCRCSGPFVQIIEEPRVSTWLQAPAFSEFDKSTLGVLSPQVLEQWVGSPRRYRLWRVPGVSFCPPQVPGPTMDGDPPASAARELRRTQPLLFLVHRVLCHVSRPLPSQPSLHQDKRGRGHLLLPSWCPHAQVSMC